MTTMKITIEDMGVTKTYEKDFGDRSILVEDYFEACLEAYDQQGYCNDIDVNIYGLGGNITQKVTWDKDNYINVSEEMNAVDDLMSFLDQGNSENRDSELEIAKNESEMYYEAWSTVWNTLCNNMPEDLWMELSWGGTGIENARDAILFLINAYQDEDKWHMGYKF